MFSFEKKFVKLFFEILVIKNFGFKKNEFYFICKYM